MGIVLGEVLGTSELDTAESLSCAITQEKEDKDEEGGKEE